MLSVLIKSRLLALLDSLKQLGGTRQKNRKRNAASVIALVAFLIVTIVASVGFMFWGYCYAFVAIGAPWAFWVISAIYAVTLCIIGSIFTVKSQIFESKDNDLLLSMPIPHKYIFISRMIVLLIVNYALAAAVLLPCLVVYCIQVGLSFGGAVGYVGVFLLLPFMALTISTVAAWIISELSSRMKHKNLITIVLFLIFFGGYMYLSFSLADLMGENGALFNPEGMKNTLVFWWAADAITNGGFLSLLYFALSSLIPAAITAFVLDKTFIRIITTKKTANKVEYKGNKTKGASIGFALLKKELLRFFTSVSYILNAGIGTVMTVVIAVIMAVSADDFLTILTVPELAWVENVIPVGAVIVCAFLGSMSFVSAPSVSLDDRQMWILQSCPVDPRQILRAKLLTHLIICTPLTVVAAIILCVAFGVGAGHSVLVVLAVISTVVLCDYFGLTMGVLFPKFGWQNENAVIKQSLAVTLSMFGGMAFFALMGVLGYFTAKVNSYLAVCAVLAISAILAAILHVYLFSCGVKKYENLKK